MCHSRQRHLLYLQDVMPFIILTTSSPCHRFLVERSLDSKYLLISTVWKHVQSATFTCPPGLSNLITNSRKSIYLLDVCTSQVVSVRSVRDMRATLMHSKYKIVTKRKQDVHLMSLFHVNSKCHDSRTFFLLSVIFGRDNLCLP